MFILALIQRLPIKQKERRKGKKKRKKKEELHIAAPYTKP